MDEENRYIITECSPKANQKIENFDDPLWAPYINRKGIYPHGELKIGQCFTVPFADVNDAGAALRTHAYKRGKQLNRKFAVIKHTDEFQCYEIARIK